MIAIREDTIGDFTTDKTLRRKAELAANRKVYNVHLVGENEIMKVYTYWNRDDQDMAFCKSICHGRSRNSIVCAYYY
jgi:hypothetical protein